MEEATKKAVSLKEELTRTERERKEAIAALKEARGELGRVAALQQELGLANEELGRARAEAGAAPGLRAEAAGLHQRNVELEQELARVRAALEAELGRVGGELERARAERDAAVAASAPHAAAPAGNGIPMVAYAPLRAELDRIEAVLVDEAARLGGIEERLRRATRSLGEVAQLAESAP
jgi:hypothetical protein